jgi:hypothetical protein
MILGICQPQHPLACLFRPNSSVLVLLLTPDRDEKNVLKSDNMCADSLLANLRTTLFGRNDCKYPHTTVCSRQVDSLNWALRIKNVNNWSGTAECQLYVLSKLVSFHQISKVRSREKWIFRLFGLKLYIR